MEHTRAIYEKIYLVVEQIPAGQVSSYGDIAEIVGGGIDARTVGYALGELGAQAAHVPWQRVVNREGAISTRGLEQRALLEAEGVAFDAHERIIMARHRWAGPGAEWAAANGCNVLPVRPAEPEQLSLF
jgi:methylated-DNA-protein-cysteine methyltransferase related protein